MGKDLYTRLTSRKFLLAVFGIIAVFTNALTPEQQEAVIQLILAFTITEGAVDLMKNYRATMN